ncbi:MAG TPA: hypothetical protein VIM79_10245 [Niastella sp.]
MGKRIQHERDKTTKLAMAKNKSFFSPGRKYKEVQCSLAEAIRTKEEADRFLAELEWLTKLAQTK